MNIQIRYFTKSKKGNTKKMADCVGATLDIESLTVENDLKETADVLFLINAMYAYNVDKEIKEFLARNKDKIKCVVNINTSASGMSTLKMIKKSADKLAIPVSDKEFHCAASWININKGKPTEDDFKRLSAFVTDLVKNQA